MPESVFNVSTAKGDNDSPVEKHETGAYLLRDKRSDGTVKRSVRVSIDPDDGTKIGETESSISREIGSSFAILKPTKSSIAREPWTEQRTTRDFIGEVTDVEEECHFVTGSSYKGSWDALGMAGVGRYVMPHGAAYEGEIRDGMFHGQGSLYWSKNKRLDVVHLRGKLQEHRYTFEDGLVYDDTNWSYCKFPDRRFYEEVKKGLRPGGRTLKTGKQPTKVLPSGCYDTGDGVFDPKTLRVTSHDDSKKVLRVPKKEEYDWIVNSCRKSWTEPTGYRPSLNENWSEDPPELPYHIAMSEDSPDSWWKRLTTFRRNCDTAEVEQDEDICSRTPEEELSVPEVCLCGQYVIFGQPCCCTTIPALFDSDSQMEEDHNGLQSFNNSSNYFNAKSPSRTEGSSTGVPEMVEVDIHNSSEAENHETEEDLQKLSGKRFRTDRNDESAIVIQNKIQQDVVKTPEENGEQLDKSMEEIDDRPTEVSAEEKTQKAEDETDEAEPYNSIDPANAQYLQNARDDNPEQKINQQDLSLENYDYAATSIQREKVSGVTEPETSNGCGMKSERSKLLPKGTTTERDLPFDRTDEEPIRSAVIVTPMIQEPRQENTTYRSVSNSNPDGLAVNILPASMEGKKTFEDGASNLSNVSSERRNFMLNENEARTDSLEVTKSVRHRNDSNDELRENSKKSGSSNPKKYPEVSVRASEKLIINRDASPMRNLDELEIETVEKSVPPNDEALGMKARNISQSIYNFDGETAKKESSILPNDDLPILEKLHRSLAALPSKEQKSIDEKEIIEIYSKFSKKGNLKTKCPNTNVWRLTGAAQDDGPQNKVKDLFHPALTAPRCELIEYMTKPCCVKVCKPPTLPEVRTSASRCRKEFPFNVPAAKQHFSVERCKHFKK